MTAQPDILQSCLQQAAQAAWPALKRCIEDAVAALQVAETQSLKLVERDALAAAWRGLLDQQAAWREHYPAALLVLFHAGVTQAPSPGALPPDTAAALSHGDLSLVDDADVAQAIESSRLLQQILPVLQHTLAELDTLMSGVQGLPNVRPELNPLRPQAFAQALRELVAASAVKPSTQALWLRYLADPLGRELQRLYERIVNQLELAQVRGASYRVLPTPASVAGRRGTGQAAADTGSGGGGAGPGGYLSDEPMAPPPSHYADLSDDDIQHELLQDFLFNDGSRAHHGLAPAYYATIEEELTALKAAREPVPAAPAAAADAALDEEAETPSDYRSLPPPERPARPVDERSALSQQLWGAFGRARERAIVRTQLKKDARQVGQVLGLEVVRKLVGQVAQDPRLLPPLREAIVALEPSLLRLAMRDPRFFSDEHHAGRRLLERVAQRSFKYNDEFSSEFLTFFEPVAAAFNALNGQVIEDARPFEGALAALQDGWDGQDQLEAQQRQHALQALRFAEERQTRADQIALTLSARSDLDKVPGLVLDFLFGPWALAMAHARLTDTRQQVDPLGFGSVVPDLLWSVKRDVTLRQPAKLIAMIPTLLGQLQAGLQLLGQQPRESEAFFAALMNLHRPVLKLRRLKSQRDADEPDAPALPPEAPAATPEQRRAKAAPLPWLARDELDAAGFEDTLPTDFDELAPRQKEQEGQEGPAAAAESLLAPTTAVSAATDPAAPLAEAMAPPDAAPPASAPVNPASGLSDAEALLLSLRPGSWVDLYSRQRWLRAQLVWASSQAMLFMFVSHGGQAHSMTRRSCERLLNARLLRPVETHGVVAQALDGVMKAAAPPAQ
ncbi:DUF1631 family protein [Polaromonas sp.]|uniref:DUF1631 family protein n=1 Tax=Polaromonas sp. TaxID=1869339 RepID=UPI0017AC2168|nr:DUF1631 family protein [Polaromonas sp.]NMM07570.1 DUF1631 domain-containing protein [Polaromonas sp.]